jgi:threonine/homoserine/homoserine lactone efflux protein
MAEYLLFGLTYGFAAAVQPGPFTAYLISRTLTQGWRRTLPAIFAPLLSDGPIALLVLLVLTRMPAGLVRWLHLLGGAFVLYLAVGAWRAWRDYETPVATAGGSERSLLEAATVNLLNPNPYLGWSLVLGPLLLRGWRESPVRGIAVVASFYGTMIAGFAGIVLLFHLARGAGPRVTRALVGLSAAALAGFGAYQLWLGTAAWR